MFFTHHIFFLLHARTHARCQSLYRHKSPHNICMWQDCANGTALRDGTLFPSDQDGGASLCFITAVTEQSSAHSSPMNLLLCRPFSVTALRRETPGSWEMDGLFLKIFPRVYFVLFQWWLHPAKHVERPQNNPLFFAELWYRVLCGSLLSKKLCKKKFFFYYFSIRVVFSFLCFARILNWIIKNLKMAVKNLTIQNAIKLILWGGGGIRSLELEPLCLLQVLS